MNRVKVRQLMSELCDLIEEHLPRIELSRYDIQYKADNSPVTKSDLYIESLILNFVRTRLNHVRFIGEESFDAEFGTEERYTVLCDPIDGTENFCSGLREWGISFSIWNHNEHLGSLLFMPELGIRLMTGDEVERVSSRLTGLSSSMAEGILNQLREPGEYRIMGCAVYNIYNVIRGSFQRFVNPVGAYIWDVLPGMMLALEHGCKVTVNDEPFHAQLLDPSRKYRIEIVRQ